MELNYSAVLNITWILYSTLLLGTTIRTVLRAVVVHFLPPSFIRKQPNIEQVKIENVKILKLCFYIEFFVIISTISTSNNKYFYYYYIFINVLL